MRARLQAGGSRDWDKVLDKVIAETDAGGLRPASSDRAARIGQVRARIWFQESGCCQSL